MANIDLGNLVASSMQDIIDSDEFKLVFAKAKKPCCDCKQGKCAKKCPCKADDKKCKKGCPCLEMNKKAEKKCCDCEKCDKECKCAGSCMDCSMCGDGMMSEAVREIVEALNKVSAIQDELGLNKSATLTMQALAMTLAEVASSNTKLASNMDENDVSFLDELLDQESHPLEEGLSYLEEEGPPRAAQEWLKFRKENPELAAQMEERVREQLGEKKKREPSISEILDRTNPVNMEGVSDSEINQALQALNDPKDATEAEIDQAVEALEEPPHFDTELSPNSRQMAWQNAPVPSERQLDRESDEGLKQPKWLMYQEPFAGMFEGNAVPEGLPEDLPEGVPEITKSDPSEGTVRPGRHVAFERLEAWINKNAASKEDESHDEELSLEDMGLEGSVSDSDDEDFEDTD